MCIRDRALTIAETALNSCTASGYRVSVAVLGRDAEVIVQIRGDGASPHTVENSFRKAYTSVSYTHLDVYKRQRLVRQGGGTW